MREASTLTLRFSVSYVRSFGLDRFVSLRWCNVRSDVVDDDRDSQAMFATQNVLEKCCFPGTLTLFSDRSFYCCLQSSVSLYLPENQTEASLAKSEVSC